MASRSTSPSSDLTVRTLSGVAMVAVAALALWLGGLWFAAFSSAIAAGTLWEWWHLTRLMVRGGFARALWLVGGTLYIGAALAMLVTMRSVPGAVGLLACGAIIAITIVIDVSAYFAGRTFGGPKIAPSISPSKTWAGLFGAMAGAAAAMVAGVVFWPSDDPITLPLIAIIVPAMAGAVLAIVAQAGDFFESWMKRRAGVKDSGSILPGHGGLFDRIDGLLPVTIVAGTGLLGLLSYARGLWSL